MRSVDCYRYRGEGGAVMLNTITLVDDSRELRFLFDILIKQELGVPVIGCPSLKDVMQHRDEVLNSQAIIIDINLGPGEPDGVEVYRWIRDQKYDGQIFFFTGHAAEAPQVRVAAKTGVPVLEKPLSAIELIDVVKGFCTQPLAAGDA